MENHIAQDAGVVDHAVDATEVVHRALDDFSGAGKFGDAVVIGRGFTAGLFDFIDHFLRRRLVAASAVDGDTDVIDHHFCAVCCGHDRDGGADAATCAGDHNHFAFHHFRICHDILSVCISI